MDVRRLWHPAGIRRTALALGLVLASLALAPPRLLAAPEVYFSPDGGIRERLLRQIHQATASIDLAIFDFTSGDLAVALLAARARGVAVRIVADPRPAQGRRSEIPWLLGAGLDVRLVGGKGRGVMHHKFAVFDGRLVATGSYNWTESAERANRENALFLDDPAVVTRYAALFERLWERAPAAPAGRAAGVVPAGGPARP